MFEFLEDAFYDWTTTGFIVWIGISVVTIYVAWFVKIPSALSDNAGFPPIVKLGLTVGIPIITYFLIQNKEWTADTFRKRGK